MNSFSAYNRKELIYKLSSEPFDLLVIGGGITGAGIALDASLRGLKVALIDMQDFAGGTSSRSTKLIHGGLRYLKQFEFRLVAEVGKEREVIHMIAPHLTKPEKMLLPIVKGGAMGKTSLRLAMWLYEWLAGVKKDEAYKMLSSSQAIKAEPLLKKEGLRGGVLFYEYRTDDARLTLEVLKTAVETGVTAVNYVRAVQFNYADEKIEGVKARDETTGETFEVKARYVINAAGPWVDELDDLDRSHEAHKLQITKGVHIVVEKKDLPVAQALYFESFDGRMIFVIPRGNKTYIGTTDTFYNGDLREPPVLEEDKAYLLKCVNTYFLSCKLGKEQIESCWAGLRPLISKPGKGPSEISRKDEIFISRSGLIIIAGGKLTGYRKMAMRVIDLVAKKIKEDHGRITGKCVTDKTQLRGGRIAVPFETFLRNQVKEGLTLGLAETEIIDLCQRYGAEISEVLKLYRSSKEEGQKHELPRALVAELKYAMENEMCSDPSDFFIRRTGMLYFDIAFVKKWRAAVLHYMQEALGWDDEMKMRYEAELERAIERVGTH